MLYKSQRRTPPRNSNRGDHIRKMSAYYEVQAQKQNDNAVEAAGYEILLFKSKTNGIKCSCSHNPDYDILDNNGQLDENTMDQIIQDVALNRSTSDNNSRAVGFGSYNDRKKEEIHTLEELTFDNVNHPTYENVSDEDDETFIAEDLEDIPYGDSFDELKFNGFDSFSSNCPVCSRTGFVGGFNMVNGMRYVFDVASFYDMEFCKINSSEHPYVIEPLDDNDSSTLKFKIKLPKYIHRVDTVRLMNGFKEIHPSKYKMTVPGIRTATTVTNRLQMETVCDGIEHTVTLEFYDPITHVEIQITTNSSPLFVDISNNNRAVSSKNINDLEQVSVVFPSWVGTIRRGDVFWEKQSSSLWVISGVELFSTSKTMQGFNALAERVKSKYEPYALKNPFTRSNSLVSK